MVKKQKNVMWLTWLLAVIAIVALVLAIVAINKANMTGEAVFWKSWGKKKIGMPSGGLGILGDFYIANGGGSRVNLKDYQVVYDFEGYLIYEILEDGTKIALGDNYQFVEGEEDILIESLSGIPVPGRLKCKCLKDGSTSGCENVDCKKAIGGGYIYCNGGCKGANCNCKLTNSYSRDGDGDFLKEFDSEYDENNDLIYEVKIVDGKKSLFLGEKYSIVQGENRDASIRSPLGIAIATTACSCVCKPPTSGSCERGTCGLIAGPEFSYCDGTCTGAECCECDMLAKINR